jgi:hypothetical protein
MTTVYDSTIHVLTCAQYRVSLRIDPHYTLTVHGMKHTTLRLKITSSNGRGFFAEYGTCLSIFLSLITLHHVKEGEQKIIWFLWKVT